MRFRNIFKVETTDCQWIAYGELKERKDLRMIPRSVSACRHIISVNVIDQSVQIDDGRSA